MPNKHKRNIQGGTSPPNRDVNAAQRATMAVRLRATKMTYEAIAGQCGYSNASAARKAILRELDRCVVKDVDILRAEELDSLERLELECWKRLANKDYEKPMLFAVDRILAIKERRARLMGLDIKTDEPTGFQVIIEEVPAGYLEGPKA